MTLAVGVTRTVQPTSPSTAVVQRQRACGKHTTRGHCTSCGDDRLQRRALAGPRPLSLPSRAISQPSEPAEVRAERTAASLVAGSTPVVDTLAPARSRAPLPSLAGLPPLVGEVLGSGGHPLDQATRAEFEPRLGTDLSHVRLHTGDRAAASADAVSAHGYTVGSDIVLGRTADRHTLAHELVHAVEERGDARGEREGRLLRQQSVDLSKLTAEGLSFEAFKASAWVSAHLPSDPDFEPRVLTARFIYEEFARRSGVFPTPADTDSFEARLRSEAPRTPFELRLRQGNPDRYEAIRKDSEIVGYLRRSGGYTEARDIEGRIVWSDEIGLEKPFLDPIDLIPFELVGSLAAKAAGLAVRTTGKAVVRSAARLTGRELASVASKEVGVEATSALEKTAAKRAATASSTTAGKTAAEAVGKTGAHIAGREAPKLVFVEVGAGDLRASIALARRGVRVVAVDPAAPAAAAIRELESAGGTFIRGTLDNVANGSADHVFQYFPWRIGESGSHVAGGTWRLVDDTTRILKPGGAAHFVTEHEATAVALTGDASRRGLRAALTETTAGSAAPGASGAGVPDYGVGLKVWLVNIYK
jgi:hypothetical protein